MSDNNAYALPLYPRLSSSDNLFVVKDYADRLNPPLDAQVRSGDYFITLATTLETIVSEISEVSIETTTQALSRLSEELSYVQKRYAISPKAKQDPLTEL